MYEEPSPAKRLPSRALPPCAATVDSALVDRAVAQIQLILRQTVVRGTDEVGRFLLKEFYNDDPELYRSSSHAKHASLRRLEERCQSLELPVRRTFLATALQLAVLARQLPDNSAFLQLPPSHRVEILRVGAPDKIEPLALRAIQHHLSVQRIREIVRKERGSKKQTRGRRPTPAVLKALGSCVKTLRDKSTGRLSLRPENLNELSREQLVEARDLAETLADRIKDVMDLLGRSSPAPPPLQRP